MRWTQRVKLSRKTFEVVRQAGGEARDLSLECRHEQEQQERPQHNENRHDDGGGERARRPPTLEPVGDRIEHVGDRHARDEGKQHAAQEVEGKGQDREADEPKAQLADGSSGVHHTPSMSAARRAQLTKYAAPESTVVAATR